MQNVVQQGHVVHWGAFEKLLDWVLSKQVSCLMDSI